MTARFVSPPATCRRDFSLFAVLAMGALSVAAPAQDQDLIATDIMEMESLADLSIEQLLNEPVTTVTRHETRWIDTPAAVTVLNNDEIRRSGATNLVELFRLVPGMNVGAGMSSTAAVSIRGFNSYYSNKLQVQVDGRSAYSPLFSGAFWDILQPMLEDVDRVEVVRGPGASVWGANAVNGVVSVVTRSARDTQGGLLYAGGGNVHELMLGGRYGGKIGENTYYRVFGTLREEGEYRRPGARGANDGWKAMHTGFRVDHYRDADTQMTWLGDLTEIARDNDSVDGYLASSMLRWTRELGESSELELQANVARAGTDDLSSSRWDTSRIDLSGEHSFSLGPDHHIVWGLGYRFFHANFDQTTPYMQIRNGRFDQSQFSGFVQDHYKLVPDRLTLTTGLKLEHNEYTGFEPQPTIRAAFTPSKDQTLWAAVSRAVRTPSAWEANDVFAALLGSPFMGPGGWYVPRILGNANPVAEQLWAYEIGYRLRATPWLTWSVSGFYNQYSDIIDRSDSPALTPGIPYGNADFFFVNRLGGDTYGGETVLTAVPADHWRLVASYSLLLSDIPDDRLRPDGFPTHQATLRSSHDLSEKAELDLQVRFVDQMANAPAYLTADVRLAYRPVENLELSLVGQNLLDPYHLEQRDQPANTSYEVPRGFYVKATWTF